MSLPAAHADTDSMMSEGSLTCLNLNDVFSQLAKQTRNLPKNSATGQNNLGVVAVVDVLMGYTGILTFLLKC